MLPRSIGVTDVPDGTAARGLADLIPESAPFRLHVGVMMNRKTLSGMPSKHDAVWPKREAIAEIFTSHPRVLNVLHYADYHDLYLCPPLAEIMRFTGPHLHAIQLDMIWPNARSLRRFRNQFPFLEGIILQVGTRALEVVGNDIADACRLVSIYEDSIDSVLIDLSMGRGVPLDPSRMEDDIAKVRMMLPEKRIAIAGGLGPETLHLAEPILAKFPGISIDAAGRLRPSGNSMFDPLSLLLARTYVERAVPLFLAYP